MGQNVRFALPTGVPGIKIEGPAGGRAQINGGGSQRGAATGPSQEPVRAILHQNGAVSRPDSGKPVSGR
jgi:hypothetical protein